jgi:hypothetical protein
MTINRGKPKCLDKNRNAWTKTEMTGQKKTEILGQKYKYLNKNGDTWTKTEIFR